MLAGSGDLRLVEELGLTPIAESRMTRSDGRDLDPSVEEAYVRVLRRHAPDIAAIQRIGRFEFYGRASEAFAVLTDLPSRLNM